LVHKNRSQIILMSFYFFFFYGAMGFIQPYLSLEFYNRGITGTQIGLINTFSSLLTFIVTPYLSIFYGDFKRKRRFTQIVIFLSGLFFYLIRFSLFFWWVLIFYTLSQISNSIIIPITENLAYNIRPLKTTVVESKFGFIRQFGSLGYALTALIGGWLLDASGINVNFFLNLTFILIVTCIISFLPDSSFNFSNFHQKIKQRTNPDVLIRVLFSDKYLFLMVSALAFFNLSNGIGQFEVIYMSQLNLSDTLIGLAITISALVEIPFMIWADYLVGKFGVSRVFIFVFIFEFVRRILVFCFPLGWVVFTTRILASIGFALFTVTTISLINHRVSSRYSTSILTLVTVTIFGIFRMVSSGISGIIFDSFGASMLYLFSALFCLFSIALSFYGYFVGEKLHKRETE